ncbi:unnamed protein product, partial [Diamesa tonsa]
MAAYESDPNYWSGQGQTQDFNFDMPDQFGQELNFQSFENTPNTAPVAPMPYANVPPPQYGGSFFDPTTAMPPANVYGQPNVAEQKSYTGNEYEDEPPLLEELGINPNHILQK